MKKILIINGHPNPDSFNYGIATAYKQGALTAGVEVKEIIVADLNFNLNLKYGYQKRTDLEPDLLDALEKIKWCDHMVWIHPVWWGGLPAMLKGFIDRCFCPDLFFSIEKIRYGGINYSPENRHVSLLPSISRVGIIGLCLVAQV